MLFKVAGKDQGKLRFANAMKLLKCQTRIIQISIINNFKVTFRLFKKIIIECSINAMLIPPEFNLFQ